VIKMNKEILNKQLSDTELRNSTVKVLQPGDLSVQETAENLIKLLQEMYVEHGITKSRDKLAADIANGNVLTWFAHKDGQFMATASLIKQTGNAWELGRAVSLDRGNGIGKRVILEALKFHLENHPNEALTAEVRAAVDFEGIPGGAATQKIFFGTINRVLPITPFAVAPLFAHGKPLRNEQFIFSATDVKPGKTISDKVVEIINDRSKKGIVPRLRVVQESPFRLVTPDDSGEDADKIADESKNFSGCTLFPIETTDKNMPLIGTLSTNPGMVICGVDRLPGNEGKPVLLIATLGAGTRLAPTLVGEELPKAPRQDIQNIADKFTWAEEKTGTAKF
jgi:predicted GNAT family N-acyltransferase